MAAGHISKIFLCRVMIAQTGLGLDADKVGFGSPIFSRTRGPVDTL